MQSVIVIGPGKAFGKILCKKLVKTGYTVKVVSRHRPEYVDNNQIIWVNLDLTTITDKDRSTIAKLSSDNLSGVVFCAVSSIYRVIGDTLSDLSNDLKVTSSILDIYDSTSAALSSNYGCFIAIGGNYAYQPNPERIGLSASKALLHSLVSVIQADAKQKGVFVYEVQIEGEARPQSNRIVNEILDTLSPGLDIKPE